MSGQPKRHIPSDLFRPGHGARPPFLAGRAAEQRALANAASELDSRDDKGRATISQDVIIYAPRGNGKTALMVWLEEFAADKRRGWTAIRVNAGEGAGDPESLAKLLAPEPWRVRAMKRGRRDIPVRTNGSSWSVAQALASRPVRNPSLVIIDEAHMLGAEASRLLLNASHELRIAGAPLLLVLAGTPELEDVLHSAKASHWERAHRMPIGRLDTESASSAFTTPLQEHGASLTEDALHIAVQETAGYPFFIQLFGRHLVAAMNHAQSPKADKAIAEQAAKAFHRDQREFHKGRLGELRVHGTLPMAAAWGAITGFGKWASVDCWPPWRRTATMWTTFGTACSAAGHCGKPAKVCRPAYPACWTAPCARRDRPRTRRIKAG